jgi:hypothetical protein
MAPCGTAKIARNRRKLIPRPAQVNAAMVLPWEEGRGAAVVAVGEVPRRPPDDLAVAGALLVMESTHSYSTEAARG